MARLPLLNRTLLSAVVVCGFAAAAGAQFAESFIERDDPAIQYATRPTTDPVTLLGRRLQDGSARLAFDEKTGYLRSLLDALAVPVESQVLVFSKTSLQSQIINPRNPRAIYFNDAVAVAWPRGGFIEIASHDPQQGVIFYVLEQRQVETPAIVRPERCLQCHQAYGALDVPGLLVKSVATEGNGLAAPQLGNYLTDHRSPMSERWAGWYVSGRSGSLAHLGNAAVADGRDPDAAIAPQATAVPSLATMFDAGNYLTPYSDIVALLVFDHQARMVNFLTRLGWEARAGGATPAERATLVRNTARDAVDYLLFVDEAPLSPGISGTSGFAERFSASGPRDRQGRSLRQLDLGTRLLRYPCSYMIYTDAVDALPPDAKDAFYRRLWQVLSGEEKDPKYSRLSAADRQAIVEILRETKKDLPKYFF